MVLTREYYCNFITILVDLVILFITVNLPLVNARVLNKLPISQSNTASKIENFFESNQKGLEYHFITCQYMQRFCSTMKELRKAKREQYNHLSAMIDCDKWRKSCLREQLRLLKVTNCKFNRVVFDHSMIIISNAFKLIDI